MYQQPTLLGSLPGGTTQSSNSFGSSPSSLPSPSSSDAAIALVSAEVVAFVVVVLIGAGSSGVVAVPP